MMKTAVLISGRGSNLQAIIDRWKSSEPTSYELELVLSNRSDAQGLERAQKAGISTTVCSHKDFSGREEFDREVDRHLVAAGIELIALAGFMRLLSPWFVKKWEGRILNIHPSLLPAFPGLHTHRKALEYGVKYSGCSVFFVSEEMDAGAIIDQAVVEVLPDDTEEALAARVLEQEHLIFPASLELVASGKIILKEGKALRIE